MQYWIAVELTDQPGTDDHQDKGGGMMEQMREHRQLKDQRRLRPDLAGERGIGRLRRMGGADLVNGINWEAAAGDYRLRSVLSGKVVEWRLVLWDRDGAHYIAARG